MSGVVAGLIASVKTGSAPAPTNLVLNPSFTTNIAGWEGAGNSARTTLFYRSASASLECYFDGDNNPAATYSRNDNLFTNGQTGSFSAWILNTLTTRNFAVELSLGGSYSLTNISVPASPLWQHIKVENKIAGTGSLVINVFPSTNDTFYIDDVSVVLGATALVL